LGRERVATAGGRGGIVLFDRSGYNRAGIDPVMGCCTLAQADTFLRQVSDFEKLLVDETGCRVPRPSYS